MAKSASRPADRIVARSVRELAALLDRSHTAVNRWLKHDAWRFGSGPWKAGHVSAIKDWAHQELNEQPGAESANGSRTQSVGADGEGGTDAAKLSIKTKADVQLKMSRNKRIVWDLEKDQGKYHLVDGCKAHKARQFAELKQGLLGMAANLAVDADVKGIVHGRMLELLRRLHAGLGLTDVESS